MKITCIFSQGELSLGIFLGGGAAKWEAIGRGLKQLTKEKRESIDGIHAGRPPGWEVMCHLLTIHGEYVKHDTKRG